MKVAEKEEVKKKEINQDKHNKKDKSNKKFIKIICKTILSLGVISGAIGLFLLYGPFDGFRTWYITSAMTTMTHQYLATWVYNEETIIDVLSKNTVIEVDGVTNTDMITTQTIQTPVVYANEYERAVLERDSNETEYKLISIEEKNFRGFLAVVYDASKVHTLVTNRLGTAGQFVTDMAEDYGAILAINGGGFEDLNRTWYRWESARFNILIRRITNR